MARDCSKIHELGLDEVERLASEAPPFKDDEGIEGRIVIRPSYHSWERSKLDFEPTAKGRRSEAYLDTKHKLRDDWSVDLRMSDPEKYQEYIWRALRCDDLSKLPVVKRRRQGLGCLCGREHGKGKRR